jgi:hypothetical protein
MLNDLQVSAVLRQENVLSRHDGSVLAMALMLEAQAVAGCQLAHAAILSWWFSTPAGAPAQRAEAPPKMCATTASDTDDYRWRFELERGEAASGGAGAVAYG